MIEKKRRFRTLVNDEDKQKFKPYLIKNVRNSSKSLIKKST